MSFEPAVLREVSLFKLFDEDELRELCQHVEERSFVAGQTIFHVGDSGGELYVVLSGAVELFILDPEGRRTQVGAIEQGQVFGEFSLFDGEPRSASAVARGPTVTCCVDRNDLALLFEKKPHAAFDILAVLVHEFRRRTEWFTQHISKNANEVILQKTTFGERIADNVARVGGSWRFINTFSLLLLVWMGFNTWQWLGFGGFDPPPFIGLNLLLSTVAALQAPIIMMSQNRQDAKDRVRADLEYEVNLRAEVGVMQLHHKVDRMKEELIDLLLTVQAK